MRQKKNSSYAQVCEFEICKVCKRDECRVSLERRYVAAHTQSHASSYIKFEKYFVCREQAKLTNGNKRKQCHCWCWSWRQKTSRNLPFEREHYVEYGPVIMHVFNGYKNLSFVPKKMWVNVFAVGEVSTYRANGTRNLCSMLFVFVLSICVFNVQTACSYWCMCIKCVDLLTCAPVSVAISRITVAFSIFCEYATPSANTKRPSASVLLISTVRPEYSLWISSGLLIC